MTFQRRGLFPPVSVPVLIIVLASFILLLRRRKHAFALMNDNKRFSCTTAEYDPFILQNPCSDAMKQQAPETYSITFQTKATTTQHHGGGNFTAHCVRQRAPVWADRIWNMARFGYYNDNYFFRVIPNKYVQFGTNGDPKVSNIYNWSQSQSQRASSSTTTCSSSSHTSATSCAILHPQPPEMPFCMAHGRHSRQRNHEKNNCSHVSGLSNTFGTLSMSTSYNMDYEEYPNGVTWNATAELFINIGDNNTQLDDYLFVPICTIDHVEMNDVVLKFQSFGEVQELGGDGPSLGLLYQDGNRYIEESNATWKSNMAKTLTVTVCS